MASTAYSRVTLSNTLPGGTGNGVGGAGVKVAFDASGRRLLAWTGHDGGHFSVHTGEVTGAANGAKPVADRRPARLGPRDGHDPRRRGRRPHRRSAADAERRRHPRRLTRGGRHRTIHARGDLDRGGVRREGRDPQRPRDRRLGGRERRGALLSADRLSADHHRAIGILEPAVADCRADAVGEPCAAARLERDVGWSA